MSMRFCRPEHAHGYMSMAHRTSVFALAKSHASPRQKLHRIVMIKLLQHGIRQRQTTKRGLIVRRKIGIDDRAGADIRCVPQLAMGPESAGEEVEAAVVAADLIGAEKEP